jgi:hypothetical protein
VSSENESSEEEEEDEGSDGDNDMVKTKNRGRSLNRLMLRMMRWCLETRNASIVWILRIMRFRRP